MEATYSSDYIFTVQGDYTDLFNKGRRLKINCGGSYKRGTIASSSYSSGTTLTTVTLESYSDALTSATPLYVAFASSKPGSYESGESDIEGSTPAVWKEGQTIKSMRQGEQSVEHSSDTASDGFEDAVLRTRGTLNNQSDVVVDDVVYVRKEQAHVNSNVVDVIKETTTIKAVSGDHALPVKTVITDNGSTGTVTLEEKRGDGVISHPNQSMAKVSTTAGTAVADSTEVKVPYSTSAYDKQSEFDTATNYRFQPKSDTSGIYHVDAQVTFSTVTATGTFQIRVKKTGSVVGQVKVMKESTTSGDITCRISLDIDLLDTDYIEVYVYQDSGSSFNLTTDATENFITIHKVA